MKMNTLVKICMMVAVVAIVFGLHASSGYGQEISTTDDIIAPANPVPPAAYVNAGTGYKIGGKIVLIEAGETNLQNIALGYGALLSDTSGASNTASGSQALLANTTGGFNTASGDSALIDNITASNNTASGYQALYKNNGSDNTGSGFRVLFSNTTGSSNFADGSKALMSNTTGSNNAAIGYEACYNLVTGSNVTCIGANSGPASDIPGPATYIAGIYGAPTTGSGNPLVCIDSTGLLGTTGCAPNGAPAAQQEVIDRQQVQIETLQRQNEELQQRMSRLEALIAQK
jgi:hypothetical protein